MKRWLARIGIGLAAVLVLLSLLTLDFVRSFRRSVSDYTGTMVVAGPTAPVIIRRDRYAIPHIQAQSFDDAAFALGYVHAQDRLWQMEMARRYIEGRLAEMFGPMALPADIQMRSLGLYRAAEEAVAHLQPRTRAALESYAKGVNAYLATHKGPLPIEFTLAGDTPEPWRPADSIAVLKGMALELSGNAATEAARAKLLGVLGKKGVEGFFPPFKDGPLPAYLDTLFATTRLGLASGIPDITASNNWVVDGAHSETGKPLLANDPHLGFTIPSTWYLAHLSIPGEDMVGGTLAGVPAIIVGRNRHVAWGMTNTGPDTQDLYVERLNPDNPGQYRTPNGYAAFTTRKETIRVRFGQPRTITVRATRHGPVMPDVPGTPYRGLAPKGTVIALDWTALAPDDTTMDTVIGINRAQDAAAFRKATRFLVSPMQNVVYADDSAPHGHIGLILPGRVPIRAPDNDSLGLVPAPGWNPIYDWQGYIPKDMPPEIIDPPLGRIATANNKTVPANYPYVIARDWAPPYRHDRIEALLTARVLHSPTDPSKIMLDAHSQAAGLTAQTSLQSVATFRAIQLDTVDTYALALRRRLIKAGPFKGTDAKAAMLLENWDGKMLRSEAAPLIFAAWARALAKRIYADELGPNFRRFWGYRPEFTLRVLDDVDGEGRWCDDKTTPAVEDCASRIRLALHDAVTQLSTKYGTDPSKWRWGDAHVAIHRAQPFGNFPVIGDWFNREVVMDGGPFTIMRGDNRMASDRPYAAVHGSGYRGIYDLKNPDQSLYIISTGESGNVFSSHYDDLMRLWAKGGYVHIPLAPAVIAKATVATLTLQPDKGVKLP